MEPSQGNWSQTTEFDLASSHSYAGIVHSSSIPPTLNQTLSASLDDCLSVLGDPAKKVLLYHLEHHFYVREEEFGLKPEEFFHALGSLLGEGARVLAEKILEAVRALRDSPLDLNGLIGMFCAKLELEIRKLAPA